MQWRRKALGYKIVPAWQQHAIYCTAIVHITEKSPPNSHFKGTVRDDFILLSDGHEFS